MKRVPNEQRHDPAATPIPPFHPDTPEVHRDWAQYHDLITAMDLQVNDILEQLEEDGLADDTIVFYYSDHGAGMPRCKKSSYDTGTRIPLIIRFPEKYAHLAPSKAGTRTDRLVSFVDFAPTVLSLIDLPVPEHMQGVAFLGKQAGEPREYVYNIRDRMAERPEFIRGVHDQRYLYLRNYRPDLAYGRYASYTQQMPTTQVWLRLAAEGKLTGPPAIWFEKTKPIEELYDSWADPWNINNLADDPEHADALKRLRAEHLRWVRATRDLGFLPEHDMLVRGKDSTPFEMGQSDETYPLEEIQQLASLVGQGQAHVGAFSEALNNSDAAIRYWGTIGLGSLGKGANIAEPLLIDLLDDSSPSVKLAAAKALVRIGSTHNVLPTAIEGLKHESEWVRLDAVLVIEKLGDAGRPALPRIQQALEMKSQFGYDHRLLNVLAKEFLAQK
jgi:N-sulfoglucosamine sulfohydrolase